MSGTNSVWAGCFVLGDPKLVGTVTRLSKVYFGSHGAQLQLQKKKKQNKTFVPSGTCSGSRSRAPGSLNSL